MQLFRITGVGPACLIANWPNTGMAPGTSQGDKGFAVTQRCLEGSRERVIGLPAVQALVRCMQVL